MSPRRETRSRLIWNSQIIKTLKKKSNVFVNVKKSKNLNDRHSNDEDDHLEGQQTRMAAPVCDPSTYDAEAGGLP